MLLLSVVNVSAQQLNFKGNSVDSLKFISYSSAFLFDGEGTTKAKKHTLLILYDSKQLNYSVAHYSNENITIRFRPEKHHDTLEIDRKYFKKYIGKNVRVRLLDSLLKAYDTTIKLSLETLHLPKPLSKYVTLKELKKVAKTHGQDWYFKSRYTMKDEKDSLVNAFKNKDTILLYLKGLNNDTSHYFVTDGSTFYEFNIYAKGKVYKYESSYPNNLGLLWFNFSGGNRLLDDTHYLINPYVNRYLVQILPPDFYMISGLKLSNLIDGYIEWFLKRREILY